MRGRTTITTVQRIAEADRNDMYGLYNQYFEGGSRQSFMRDLAGKGWVIRLWDDSGILAGFSTLQSYYFDWAGRRLSIFFSGDTIVRPSFQAQSGLVGAFGHLVHRLRSDGGPDECFWFLISKGFRTYRMLPGYFLDFLPRPDDPIDSERQTLLHALAADRFGKHYDPDSGLIRAWPGKDRLNPVMCRVPDNYMRCPYTRFFLERNPGFRRGDELACLAPMHPDNYTPAAHRRIHAVSPVWEE